MAASIAKSFPKTLSLISCRFSAARIACCCSRTHLLSNLDSKVQSYARRQSRYLFTYSQLRQHDVFRRESKIPCGLWIGQKKPNLVTLFKPFTGNHMKALFRRIEPETNVVEPVVEEVPDTDEPDVLYKKIVVEVKGHDQKVLHSYEEFVKLACKHLEIKIGKISKPKADFDRLSVLRSVHIHKKHYSQFEQRTHFLVFEIPKLTGSTADTFLEYVQRNLPEGVAMKVTRHRLEKFPEHLVPPTKKTEKQLDTS